MWGVQSLLKGSRFTDVKEAVKRVDQNRHITVTSLSTTVVSKDWSAEEISESQAED